MAPRARRNKLATVETEPTPIASARGADTEGGEEEEILLTLRAYVPKRKKIKLIGRDEKTRIHEMHMLREFSPVRRQRISNTWELVVKLMEASQKRELTLEEEEVVEDGYLNICKAAFPTVALDDWEHIDATQKELLAGYFFRVTAEEREKDRSVVVSLIGG